jgi:hypothetical protein
MISLSLFWLILSVSYFIIGTAAVLFSSSQKNVHCSMDIVNFLLTCVLAWASFYLTFSENLYADIIRISNEIRDGKLYGLSYLFKLYGGNPLDALLYYSGVVLGDTRFVSVISVFLTFGLLFASIGLFSRRNNISGQAELLATFMLMNANNFVSSAFNIRFNLATAVLIFALELGEWVQNSIFPVALAITGVLIHNGTLPLFLIYLAAKYLKGKSFYALMVPVLFFGGFVGAVFPLLQRSGVPFLSALAEKGISYFIEGAEFDESQSTGQWIFRLCWLIFICSLALMAMPNKSYVNESRSEKYFFIGLIALSVGSLPMGFTAVSRYSLACVEVSIFVVMFFLNVYMNISRKGSVQENLYLQKDKYI